MKREEALFNLLDADPIHEAEQITGLSYKEDEDTSRLGIALHFSKGEALSHALLEAGDMPFNTPFKTYIQRVTEAGFQVISSRVVDFEHSKGNVWMALWNTDGLLLIIESYGDNVNCCHLHFNLRLNDGESCPQSCSGQWVNGVWCGDFEAREALFTKLRRLKGMGEFLPKWEKCPYIWLGAAIKYDDGFTTEGREKIDLQKKEVLSGFPKEILDAMGEP